MSTSRKNATLAGEDGSTARLGGVEDARRGAAATVGGLRTLDQEKNKRQKMQVASDSAMAAGWEDGGLLAYVVMFSRRE